MCSALRDQGTEPEKSARRIDLARHRDHHFVTLTRAVEHVQANSQDSGATELQQERIV